MENTIKTIVGGNVIITNLETGEVTVIPINRS